MRRLMALMMVLGTISAASQTQQLSQAIEIDFSKMLGTIKHVGDIHSGPLTERGSLDLTPYYRQLDVKLVRLHDVPWTFGDGVDINYVFPHLDRDAENPDNYEFASTDRYVESIRALGADMIFRCGYSAEIRSQPGMHRAVPADFKKWARICVNIIRHYNQGWASGMQHTIKYVEIWNEPDIPNFWSGTPEQYYSLYETTARALKQQDPTVKVGGPALAAHLEFLDGFLGYCQSRNLPLDFVSWHIYGSDPLGVPRKAGLVNDLLRKHGFEGKVESILDEWNYFPGDWDRIDREPTYESILFRTQILGAPGAAYDAAVLAYLQDAPVDRANFYTGTTFWWGMFDRHGAPLKPFYTFLAFRFLLDTPQRVQVASGDSGFAVVAGLSAAKTEAGMLLSNSGTDAHHFNIVLKNLPFPNGFVYDLFVVDEYHDLTLVKSQELNSANLTLSEDVQTPSVTFIRLRQAAR